MDKRGNFFGSIVFHKGNIASELLKNGLATLVEWSAALCPDNQLLHESAQAGQRSRVNLFRDHVPEQAKESKCVYSLSCV